jgi:peptidoglycan hydrolase-like protein with peptidoglycan-binding domain
MAARYLHVTSPLMTGPEVVRIQEKLTLLGYAPGPVDGEYGPATRRTRYVSQVNGFGRVTRK